MVHALRRHAVSLCLALLCVACAAAPPTIAPPEPASAGMLPSPTALGTSTPEPAAAVTPTSVPPGTTRTPVPCLATVAPQPQTQPHPVRIVYADEGKLWRWEEETGTATAYLLHGEAYDARLSDDGQLIAFRRPVGERVDEVWVVDVNGGGERRLATFSAEDTAARYAWTGAVQLVVDWLPGAHTLACYYEPDHRFVEYGPYEALQLVDAESGASHTISTVEDEVLAFACAPGGRQVAVLTARDLRLVDVSRGEVWHRVPVKVEAGRSQSLGYSPDGRYLVVFTERAITLVDAADGTRRGIPFDYQPVGMGEYSLYPRINWLDDGAAFYTAFQADPLLATGPAATFTVWQVDVPAGTVKAVDTFRGSFTTSEFSPDRRWLAYPAQRENNQDLYLADVQSGRQILYEQGGWAGLRGWNPDSARFVYQDDETVALGHICQASRILQGVEPDPGLQLHGSLRWIDGERFLTVNCNYANYSPWLWTLRLNSLSGEITIIATLRGSLPRYGYYLGS